MLVTEPSSPEIFQSTNNETAPDIHVQNLQKIFGLNANITKDNESFKVDVVLKSGICPGGQRVETVLKQEGQKNLYKATELSVDGASFPEIFNNTFFFKLPTERKNIVEEKRKPNFLKSILKQDINDDRIHSNFFTHLTSKFAGNKGFNDWNIILVNLEDADGLAAIFHEIGHTRDNTSSLFYELNASSVFQYIHNEGHGYKKDQLPEIRKSGEEIIEFEMFANKMAIKGIELTKEKGYDLFKNDENLQRVKRFLVTTTMTRFYKTPKFIELVGKEKIDEILKI